MHDQGWVLIVGAVALVSIGVETVRTLLGLRAGRGSKAASIPALDTAGQASKVLIAATRNGVIMGVLGDCHAVLGWSATDLIGASIASALVPKAQRLAHLEGMALYRDTGHAPVLGKALAVEALDQQGTARPIYLTVFGYEGYSRLIYGLIERREP